MDIATRMSRLGTESAFEVLARARALERTGREIIHLEIGEPDFDTPQHIRDAAKRALDEGATHYGPAAGLPELREAIAKHVSATRGVPVSPDEVVVTPGGKPIMFFTILALVNAGDEVIHPNPGFPIYESVVNCRSRCGKRRGSASTWRNSSGGCRPARG
jgi:aspartate/methionine/tyrosine aminotransferase